MNARNMIARHFLRYRGAFYFSSVLVCFSLFFSFPAVADKSPLYEKEGVLGPKHTLNEELNLRIKGLIDANYYIVRNHQGKPVERPDDLNMEESGKTEFSISTSTPGLSLTVSARRQNGGVTLQIKDVSKSRKKPLDQSLVIPWQKPSAQNLQVLLKEIEVFSEKAEKGVAEKPKDLNGGAPPSHLEMVRLALLISLKHFQPQESDREGSLIFYNLLNYLFNRLDSV